MKMKIGYIYPIKAETVNIDRQPRDSRPALMMAG